MLSISHLSSVVGVSRSRTDYSTAVIHVSNCAILHAGEVPTPRSYLDAWHVQPPFLHYPRAGWDVTEPREPSGLEASEQPCIHKTEHYLPQLGGRSVDPEYAGDVGNGPVRHRFERYSDVTRPGAIANRPEAMCGGEFLGAEHGLVGPERLPSRALVAVDVACQCQGIGRERTEGPAVNDAKDGRVGGQDVSIGSDFKPILARLANPLKVFHGELAGLQRLVDLTPDNRECLRVTIARAALRARVDHYLVELDTRTQHIERQRASVRECDRTRYKGQIPNASYADAVLSGRSSKQSHSIFASQSFRDD